MDVDTTTAGAPKLIVVLPEKERGTTGANAGGPETPGVKGNDGATKEDKDRNAGAGSDGNDELDKEEGEVSDKARDNRAFFQGRITANGKPTYAAVAAGPSKTPEKRPPKGKKTTTM